MTPKANDIIIDYSVSHQGTVFLKVISPREVDKAWYWEQAGKPRGAEVVRWSEETGMNYMTMWWPDPRRNGG